jgi:tRNA-dihydrouridine synthase B
VREAEHAAAIIRAMADAVSIPVTVTMRAGWNESAINAPELAKRVEDAGAAAVAVHGRTAAQSYSGESDWDLIGRVAEGVRIPVFGSGDCVEADHVVTRLTDSGLGGVLVGRGALRNPWIFRQAADVAAGRPPRQVTPEDRARFLLDYIDLLLLERLSEAAGFRHTAADHQSFDQCHASGRERWIINKLRALAAWYTKGLVGGAALRTEINQTQSIDQLKQVVVKAFVPAEPLEICLSA